MLSSPFSMAKTKVPHIKGRQQNSLKWDDKSMLRNIGDLFVKCMRQDTMIISTISIQILCNV